MDFPVLEDWMTATDVAAALGVSRQTVNRMINSGAFSTTRTLGVRENSSRPTYVVEAKEVRKLLAERSGEPTEAPVEAVAAEVR